jgi:hypothetical protein
LREEDRIFEINPQRPSGSDLGVTATVSAWVGAVVVVAAEDSGLPVVAVDALLSRCSEAAGAARLAGTV